MYTNCGNKIKIKERLLPIRYIDCETKDDVYKHYKYLIDVEDYDEEQIAGRPFERYGDTKRARAGLRRSRSILWGGDSP